MTPERLVAENVSRETFQRLQILVGLVEKWQSRVNLVSRESLKNIWHRHVLDSAQIHGLLPPNCRRVVDLGSGAGFPGLVLAACGVPEMHLIESDGRKCTFLTEAAQQMGLRIGSDVVIHRARIEAMSPIAADAVTARACAPFDRLLGLAAEIATPHTTFLFMKGRNVEEELTAVERDWLMSVEKFQSTTDPTGVILRIRQLRRSHD